MSHLNPLKPWTPGPGPLYTTLHGLHSAFHLPTPSGEYMTWYSGLSPLSRNRDVVAAIGTYLLVIFGGREIMR